jgi:hypothetical protein
VVRVPFVGCESDGNDGRKDAPEDKSKAVGLDGKDSKRFAYYEAERSAGVVAPWLVRVRDIWIVGLKNNRDPHSVEN